jgi:hypothetical protein
VHNYKIIHRRLSQDVAPNFGFGFRKKIEHVLNSLQGMDLPSSPSDANGMRQLIVKIVVAFCQYGSDLNGCSGPNYLGQV